MGRQNLMARDDGRTSLQQSGEQFRLLVENVSEYAIFSLDADGRIASWNLGAQRIKGYSAAEVLGRHFRIFYRPEEQQAGHPEWVLATARRDGRYEEEGWRVRKDGTRFWANVVVTPLHDSTGELIGFAKISRDITQRRNAQRERERVAAELEAANEQLAQANTQLAAANTQLAQANQRLAAVADDNAQFLAVTAHELRTPVRVVTGAAELVADHWSDLDDEERTGLIDAMRTSGGRIRRLLQDLLTAARLEAGGIEIRSSRVPLRTLLVDTVGQAITAHPELDVTVECHPELAVQADPDRLAQMLSNYLTNAVQYGQPPIEVTAGTRGRDAIIEVRDHGPGVPVEHERRLFDKFARGGGDDRGTGLGLFIVREMARAQDGEAWYERHDDLTCFCLRLPLAST